MNAAGKNIRENWSILDDEFVSLSEVMAWNEIIVLIFCYSDFYEGAEVEKDINVLDGDICPRTCPWRGRPRWIRPCPHRDILPRTSCPCADIMSSMDVLGGDIRSKQGRPQRGRPRRGHLCPFLLLPLRSFLSCLFSFWKRKGVLTLKMTVSLMHRYNLYVNPLFWPCLMYSL